MNILGQQKEIGRYDYGGKFFVKRLAIEGKKYDIFLNRDEAQEFIDNCYLKRKKKFLWNLKRQ